MKTKISLDFQICISVPLAIRIIYFRKVPLGALANKSAASFLEKLNNKLLSAELYSEPRRTSKIELSTKNG